jgi:hypothetical protein
MKSLLTLLLLVGAAPLVTGAEPEPGASARYEEADADRDGRISREEFINGIRNKRGWWSRGSERANTGQNSATPEMFTALDRDRDGFLSHEELESGRKLRESRGDNSFGASGTRSNRPAPTSQTTTPEKPR